MEVELRAPAGTSLPHLPVFGAVLTRTTLLGGEILQSALTIRHQQSLSPSAMVGEHPGLISEARFSPVALNISRGVTGLDTNVLAKLKRKRKHGNTRYQKTPPPLTLSSAEQCLTDSFELEGVVDLFPFPLLTFVSCTTASGIT